MASHSDSNQTNYSQRSNFCDTKIIQWNCRSLHQNLNHFKAFLSQNKTDIICLQSVLRSSKELPYLDGFYFPPFYQCNKDGKVALATYVSTKIKVSFFPSPTPNKDHLALTIKVATAGRDLLITNVYYPETVSRINLTKWISDLDTNNKDWLIVGDFNAHHSDWGGEGTITRGGGNHLSQHITDSDFILLNDGSITRLPHRFGDNPSAIDLSLVTPGIGQQTTWQVLDDDLGSDHIPILISISRTLEGANTMDENGFNYDKANWDLFSERLQNFEPIPQDVSIQEQYDIFCSRVLQVAYEAIPLKKHFENKISNPWWNDDCAKAVKIKSQAYSVYKKRSTEANFEHYKKTRRDCKRVINTAKTVYWEKFVKTHVKEYRDTTKVWKKIKKLKRQYKIPDGALKVNGLKITSNKEKAEVFADTFATVSQTASLPRELREHRQEQEANFSSPNPDNQCPINQDFSIHELRRCLNDIKKAKKATGVDKISYLMIKHLPEKALYELLGFYNRCYSFGTVPKQWKMAEVVPIHKNGKPRCDPSSYRPISLTPHLGKVYERLLKSRLEFHLEKHNIIPSFQAGFRRGRGCTDHLVKLSSHIKKSLKRNKPTLATFFDVKRAFDSVWIAKLLQKLSQVGIQGNLYEALKTLMTNRSIRVKVGSELSSERTLDMGVAQGTIYAPICFSLMLHDLKYLKFKNASIMLYADDLTLWQESRYNKINTPRQSKEVREKFQFNVDLITRYMENNGFLLSPEKTQFVVFKGLKRSIRIHELFITVQGKRVDPSKTAKYLGVVFDDCLNFKSHIETQVKKVKQLWPLLKTLKCTPGCSSTVSLLHVARALVRSRLTYGQEAYFTASPNDLRKLQNAETAVLRFILGLARGSPPSLVYREAGWLPLPEQRNLNCAQYLIRAKSTNNSTDEELNVAFDNNNSDSSQKVFLKKPYMKIKALSFYNYTENLLKEANIDPDQIKKTPIPIVPIWTEITPTIDHSYCNESKSKHIHYVSTVAREKMESKYANSLQIFTDGSKLDDGSVGCSFCIPKLNITKRFKLNSNISIMSAELFAIYMALAFVADCPRIFFKVVIFSDSKSALQAIENLSKNRLDLILEIYHLNSLIYSKGTELDLVWIPSHCNISGNDQADVAAKEAARGNGHVNSYDIGYTRSELCARLKAAAWKTWANRLKSESENRSWPYHLCTSYDAPMFLDVHLQSLFHRLRVRVPRFHFCQIPCACGSNLSFDHIFQCLQLRLLFVKTCENLRRQKLQFNAHNVSWPINGSWSVAETFVKELYAVPIAYAL